MAISFMPHRLQWCLFAWCLACGTAGAVQATVSDVLRNRAFFLRYGSVVPPSEKDWRQNAGVLNADVFDQGTVREGADDDLRDGLGCTA